MNRIIALAAAVIVVAVIAFGFAALRSSYGVDKSSASIVKNAEPQTAATPAQVQIQVLQNDVYVRAGQAVIGGSVRNVSNETIENINLRLKLENRVTAETKFENLELKPSTLAPQSEATYGLKLPVGQWNAISVQQITASGNDNSQALLSFRTGQGKLRPIEAAPSGKTKIVVVERRLKPKNGEEFINTPETAISIK